MIQSLSHFKKRQISYFNELSKKISKINNEGLYFPSFPFPKFMFKPDIAFVTVKLLVLFKIMITNATNLTEQEISTFTYLFLAYYLLCH